MRRWHSDLLTKVILAVILQVSIKLDKFGFYCMYQNEEKMLHLSTEG